MSKRTTNGTELTVLILEVFRVNGALLSAGNRLTEPHGLTSARWQVMGPMSLAERPLTVPQIARRMGLTRQAVQRVVNDLRGLAMIRFADNPDHKRAPLVLLTKLGKSVYKDIDAAQIAWVNDLAAGLGQQKLSAALAVLKKLSVRLKQVE